MDGISISDSNLDNSQSFDLLSKCPRSVVLKILDYFSFSELVHNISLVCKNWRSRVYDPHLWSNIDLLKYKINDRVLSTLPTLCNFITYIVLPDDVNDELSDTGMIALAKGCPNLQTLHFPRCGSHFSEEAFIAFTEHCKDLRDLHFDGVEISDRILHCIAINLEKLEFLSLIQASSFTSAGVCEVFKRCRRLYECRLNQNEDITGKCFEALSESSKSLSRVDLRMCRINPASVAHLAVLPNLTYLNLTDCRSLLIQDLLPVLKACMKISCLGLSLNKNIDDDCVDIILSHLRKLAYIFLVSTAISDQALNFMAEKGHSLVHIDIGHNKKVTDAGVRVVSEKCPNLDYFGLMSCKLVKEQAVNELVKRFPHIMYSTFMQDAKRQGLLSDEDS